MRQPAQRDSMSEENKYDQQPTLTDFIEKNHKLITTAGVLATLSVLTGKVPQNQVGPIGRVLSFLLFFLVLLICLEIFGNFPWTEKGKIYWFRQAYVVIVLEFTYILILTFYPFLLAGLLMVVVAFALVLILAGCSAAIRGLVMRMPWFKKVNQRTKEQIIPLVGAMALMTAGLIILRHFKLFWRY
jgi:hypothetical protein